MKHQEGFIKSKRNENIYYQYWLPENEIKANIMVVHGLAEHSGRYMNVVNQLIPAGYGIFALDHIGHGKSDGTRVFVETFQDFITTLKISFDKIQSLQPGKPIFIMGHSMGGMISAAYLLEYQNELAGAVLSGPGFKIPETITPTMILLNNIFSAILPKFGLVQLDANGVSRDPAVVDAYINDPLVDTGKTTSRLGSELIKTIQTLNKRAQEIELPTIIMQGTEDILVDPEGAPLMFEKISSSDKTLKMYEGLHHEIFNEPEHEAVIQDVIDWLDDQMNK
ncbi:MAG: lysophospholipase [Anaerolineaceae bacterium]|nr:lysophospholipase [Anaerolineaceae bacterium]